jgi:endonuclease G, mitochondrial
MLHVPGPAWICIDERKICTTLVAMNSHLRSCLRMRALALALAALAACTGALAHTSCPQHFAAGMAPQASNPRMQPHSRELCYLAFAVMHSGITRGPLWSAEHLTGDALAAARQQVRSDAFHPEPRLPRSERAELADYARSGFDRGHMTPSGDAASPEAQAQTFTLANMIPQASVSNRGIWAEIERAVRELARERGQLYVITGPLFEAGQLRVLKRRVLVPTGMFKLVYDPVSRRAAAYVSGNDASGTYAVVSLGEFEQRSGLLLLPGDTLVRSREPLALPPAHPARARHRQRRTPGVAPQPSGDSMYASKHALRALARHAFQ